MKVHCISDGDCKKCVFRESCVVHGIYYHPLKIIPDAVKDGGSLGYTFECLDRRTYINAGDQMQFSLLLYGDVIVYFPVILDALFRLGMSGIGQKKQGKFQVIKVIDQDNGLVFDNATINPKEIHVRDLSEDAEKEVSKRTSALQSEFYNIRIRFLIPWTQKWRGRFLEDFNAEAFITSAYRRVYLMHCMEGIPFPEKMNFDLTDLHEKTIELYSVDESRYSNTHENRIRLRGIRGDFILSHVPADALAYIFGGEIVHIGKNTSIGFGQYRVIDVENCSDNQKEYAES